MEVIGFEVAITQNFSFVFVTKNYNGMQQNKILKNVNKIDIQRCSYFSNVCNMARSIVQQNKGLGW